MIRTEAVTCRCGARLDVAVVDRLDAARHPDLRARVLDRTLHTYRCAACGGAGLVERAVLYIDLDRRQLLGVHPAAARPDADHLARELVEVFDRRLRDGAPAPMRALASDCLVRLCFGLEELREKLVADDARVDDLALEAIKADLLVRDRALRAAGVVTFVLDVVAGRRLTLIAVGVDGTPRGPVIELDRGPVDDLARRHAEILARLPGVASGPHVSLLRLAR